MLKHIETSKDYAEYQERVADFLKDFDSEPSAGVWECPACGSNEWCGTDPCPACGEDGQVYLEPSFSWRSCDCCGSNLGGDREDVIGWLKGAREHKFSDDYKWSGSVCVDCIYYFAYSRLDDMTMLEVQTA